MTIAIGTLRADEALRLPAMPDDVFVGTMEGRPSCANDEEAHDIWPKFMVMALLQGRQRFVIDDTPFLIDAGAGAAARPAVVLLNVARYAKLRFVNDSAVPLRKAMVSAPRPWVMRHLDNQGDGQPALRRFFDRHLARFEFRPGHYGIALVEQMLRPPALLEGELAALYRRSRALELMLLGCSALVEGGVEGGAEVGVGRACPPLSVQRQAERVRDYVIDRLSTPLTIETIAREVGASVSAVQRHFKSAFGITVFDFIRLKRLEGARARLERDGISIAEAAFAAGYANPTAFAAAFRKTFGAAPRDVRR